MPRLTPDKQATVLSARVEGASIRATERMTGVEKKTIGRLILRTGKAAQRLLDEEIRHVRCDQLQLDEVWCFVGKKKAQLKPTDDVAAKGDFWTWVALDPESKLVPSHVVGKRGLADAHDFLRDLRRRVDGRCQLNTDRLNAYRSAIWGEWSEDAPDGGFVRPDWGSVVKRYKGEPTGFGRYSPPKIASMERRVESGTPDEGRISTSHVERQHLTMRMGMRRFTRLTNGFSKSVESLRAAVAVHFVYYNFVRKHETIKTTPALAAGVADRRWTMLDLVEWAGCFPG